jgi:excisionase family DNA binding protein
LTIAQTCQVTNLGETKVRELIKAGRLKVVQVGRRQLVQMTSVKALLGLA